MSIADPDFHYIYYALGLGENEGKLRIINNPAIKLSPDEKSFNVNLLGDSVDKYFRLKKKPANILKS